jgi:hypothetical protein
VASTRYRTDEDADRIRRATLEPERLVENFRKARQTGGGAEYASAIGAIRGTTYVTRDPAERVMFIDRILDALESVTYEED